MAGRPTDYTEELLEKARAYEADFKSIFPDDVLPTLEGLALHLGISRETIYAWESQEGKEIFSDIVSNIRQQQAKTLVNKGLKGEYNASIAKVMLTKHGYREGIDTTSDGKAFEVSNEHKALADAALSHILNGNHDRTQGTTEQTG